MLRKWAIELLSLPKSGVQGPNARRVGVFDKTWSCHLSVGAGSSGSIGYVTQTTLFDFLGNSLGNFPNYTIGQPLQWAPAKSMRQ